MGGNHKKAILSIVCLALAGVSFFILASFFGSSDSSFYTGVQERLDERFVAASVVFGLTKLASGVLSFLQSVEVEAGIVVAGINLSPLKLLAPVASTVDQLSNLFLWAMGAILLQKFLMYIAGWVAFKLMIPVACVLFGVYVWTRRIALRNVAILLAGLAITITMAVPASVKLADYVEAYFLADVRDVAIDGIEDKQEALSNLQDNITVAPAEERSTWSIIKENLSASAIQEKLKAAVADALDYAQALVTHLLNLFIVTLITVLVIPLATLAILWVVLYTIMKRVMGI
jgi:hypothetical protein